jgi:hypothetical protein
VEEIEISQIKLLASYVQDNSIHYFVSSQQNDEIINLLTDINERKQHFQNTINQAIIMNFKTLTASIVVLFEIASPAVANPNWKVFGRSNGGSEIALDTNSFNQSGNTFYFVYRITKNNEPFYHKGRTTDCFVGDSGQTNGRPKLWQSIDNPAEPVNVFADSPASQNMLINVCRSAKAKVNSLPEANYSRSAVDELRSFSGTNCQSTLKKEGSETIINCNQVTIKTDPSDSSQSIVAFSNNINDKSIAYTINNTPTYHDDANFFEVVQIGNINNAVPGGTFSFKYGSCFLFLLRTN